MLPWLARRSAWRRSELKCCSVDREACDRQHQGCTRYFAHQLLSRLANEIKGNEAQQKRYVKVVHFASLEHSHKCSRNTKTQG